MLFIVTLTCRIWANWGWLRKKASGSSPPPGTKSSPSSPSPSNEREASPWPRLPRRNSRAASSLPWPPPPPAEGWSGIPVNKYSTALSGLLKLALSALSTWIFNVRVNFLNKKKESSKLNNKTFKPDLLGIPCPWYSVPFCCNHLLQ